MKNLTHLTQIDKTLIAIALLFSVLASAQVKQTFSPRFNQTVKGNVTIIANNMLSRSATGAYNGSADNHDFTDNVYVDIDSDASTFNSSSANFVNPQPNLECLTIKKVLLYWAAADKEPTSDLNSQNQPNWNYNDIKVMLPGQNTYTTLTATGSEIIYRGRNEASHFSNDPYICVKDITNEVASLGNPYGKYQVANIEAKIGSLSSHGGGNTGTSGGWQIVFVYESPNLPRKNVTLFDGYAHVTSSVNNFDIDFNGFQTIPTGNVNADILIGALEGDRGLSGDRLQIKNPFGTFVDISAPLRSSSNFFNSKITIGASDFVDRNPASTNTLGFDAAVFNLSNPGNTVISNNQTSAVLRLTSNQETYGLFLVGLAVDVYAPDLDPMQLQTTSTSPVNPGDPIGFNFNVQNNGNDDAINLAISTTLPPQVEFVSANNLPAGVTYTYNPTTGNLTFNFADGLADIDDPNLNIDFQLMIKDQCYFLEESCDLTFDLQFVATYNGVLNSGLQNTMSSSGLRECNLGNLLPLTININQPAAAVWATPAQALDVILECNDTTGLAAAQALAPETDKCDFDLIKTSGPFVPDAACGNNGTYTNTWTFTDACGRTISDFVQVITLATTSAPSLIIPEDVTVECGNDTTPASTGIATGTNSCGSVTISFTDQFDAACGDTGVITRTWQAADECGGNAITGIQTITIVDTTAPTIVIPENISVECGEDTSSSATGVATGTDTCGEFTITQTDSSEPACGNTSRITRTWTATDACGNSASGDQIITVVDTTAPTLEVPADIVIECSNVSLDTTDILNDNDPGTATGSDTCGITIISFVDSIVPGCGNTYVNTRTWTATDQCGNTVSDVQIITITDTTPPVFNAPLPQDISVECDAVPSAPTLTATDNCGNVSITFNETSTAGSCPSNYTIVRTWTATDDCGLNTVHTQTISVADATAPTFVETLPADVTVECDDIPSAAILTATDSCGSVTVNFEETRTDGSCAFNYILTRTWTATNLCGLTTIHTQTVTVQDTTAPLLTTPATDVIAECDGTGNSGAIQDWLNTNGGATATDNCGTISWTNDYTGSASDCSAPVSVTFTATDECGNFIATTATYAIQDSAAPVITGGSDLTVECDGNGNLEALNNWLATQAGATATDDCSAISWSNNYTAISNDCGATGSATVTFTATDGCGNTASITATFSIQDSTPPVINVNTTDLTVECDGNGNIDALNTWLASNGGNTASDSCSDVTWTNNYSGLSDACGNTGSATVIFTATDACGNSVATSATFTIQDTIAPTIDIEAADLTVECDGTGNTADLNNWLANQGGASASDSCSDITWSNNYENLADGCGNSYVLNVTFTATDDCGNATTTSAIFTVEDTIAPMIDVMAADLNVECDGNGNMDDLTTWLATQGGATASDDCSDVIWTNNYNELTNGCGATGSATVTFTATDACGNSATTAATFTIEDTTSPVLIMEATNIVVECDGNGTSGAIEEWLNTNGNASASDACSTITWTNDYAGTPSDCSAPVAVTFTATDDCGNAVSTTATYSVQDTVPPMISGGSDLTVQCDGNGNIEDLNNWLANQAGATASDNCSAVSWSNNFSALNEACGATGSATVIFTATDGCGNSATISATFTIEDTTAPTIDSNPTDLTVECDGNGNLSELNNWLANQGGASASDLCSNVSWTNNYTELTDGCGATGSAVVTFTALDDCGNASTVSASFTIQDTTAPVIEMQATDMIVECDGSGNTDDLNNWLASQGGATAIDACSNVTWTYNEGVLSDNCGNGFELNVTFTATDECGNAVNTSATFTVEDTTAPVIETLAADLIVECDGNGNIEDLNAWLASQGGASASDACSVVTWENDFNQLSGGCGATGTVTVTFTAYDDCKNESNTTATFTIIDTIAPVIDIEAINLTVECDGNGNMDDLNDWLATQGGASASDTCSNVTWANNFTELSNDCGNTGSASVTFTATDDCGNIATTSAIFTIIDTTDPVLEIPATNIVVECDGSGNNGAIEEWLSNHGNASATDACAPNVTWTNDYAGTVSDCSAPVEVTFTATDDCGNSVSTIATYTIQDTVPPVITGGTDVTVECDGSGNIEDFNNWLASQSGATASDNCSEVTWSNNFNELSDDCGATGSATVTFTATDGCGNSAATIATFSIVDTIAPVIDTQATNLTVECDGNGNMEALNEWLASQGGASASDLCSNVVWTSNYSELSEDCGATGSASVTFTATDDCGNTATSTATFSIVDTIAPVIDTQATNLTVECDGNGNMEALNEWLASQGGATASDACSNVTWTNNVGDLSDDCGATGSVTVIFTATDDCGNTSTSTATFSIEDTTAPQLDAIANDLTVECDGNGNENDFNNWIASNGGASASDPCSSVVWSNDYTGLDESCGATGSATVTFTATDDCGNSITTSAMFNIVDMTPPTMVVEAQDLTVECDGSGNMTQLNAWLASQGGASATETCSDVTWSNDFSSLTPLCGNTGSATVTFTAADDCGNTAATIAMFTIVDTTAPEIVGEFESVINVNCDMIPEIPNLEFQDACSTDIDVNGPPTEEIVGDISSNYQIIRTWTVDDSCNTYTYTQTINVTVQSAMVQLSSDLCQDIGPLDLFDELPADVDTSGTWVVTSENATLSGSIFDQSNADFGDYIFTYTEAVNGECPTQYELTITVIDCMPLPCGEDDLIISTTVTPNGDSYNEFFTVGGIEDCGFTVELQIFNRWGAKIYENFNYQNDWNGFASKASIGNSDKVPTGTYYYIINLKNSGLKPFAGPIYVATK